jgi:hypothetical protein
MCLARLHGAGSGRSGCARETVCDRYESAGSSIATGSWSGRPDKTSEASDVGSQFPASVSDRDPAYGRWAVVVPRGGVE